MAIASAGDVAELADLSAPTPAPREQAMRIVGKAEPTATAAATAEGMQPDHKYTRTRRSLIGNMGVAFGH
jgi:hypothetical protein